MLTLYPDDRPSASKLLSFGFFGQEPSPAAPSSDSGAAAASSSAPPAGLSAGGAAAAPLSSAALPSKVLSPADVAVVSPETADEDPRFEQWRSQIDEEGYVVVEGHIPVELARQALEDIRERIAHCLRGYSLKVRRGERLFDGLLEAVPKFHTSPANWDGPRFGAIKCRGWQKALGSGRLFEGYETQALLAVQELCRPLVAAVLRKDGAALQRKPEKISVKPATCPELAAHLDTGRKDGLQIVIALSVTSFLVWPRSHKSGLAERVAKIGFYQLTNEEIQDLPKPRLLVPAAVGDVLVMRGGTLVHGSPATEKGDPTRIVTYANFDP